MKEKILKIEHVKVDDKYYPRMKWDWQTSYKYSMAVKSGATFPLIEVAMINGQYYLVDGRHRIEAYRMLKADHVQVLVNDQIKDLKKLYIVAVQRNVIHGKQFGSQDKVSIALKLKDLQMTDMEFSKLIAVPLNKLESFIAKRMTSTINGTSVPLKSPMMHLSETIVDDDFNDKQSSIALRSQVQILSQVIHLLENGLIDTKDVEVTNRLQKIYNLLKPLHKRSVGRPRKTS